jgi:hypothetical protein
MFVAAALVSQSALAEVRLRAGVGASSYKLGGDYTGAKSDYNSTNVGVTFAADNGFYVDLAGSSGSGKHDGWATANTPSSICAGGVCPNVASPDEDFKRSDYALIVGGSHLNPNNGIAVTFYGGLKGGTTTLGAKNAGLAWTEETFDTAGVVFGGGASFPIAQGRAGAVGVNLGLGIMGATWKDNNGFSVKSNTAVGFSLGASYTYPITSNFGVVADYKLNAYSYNFGDTANPFTVNEAFSTLGGSLYVKF